MGTWNDRILERTESMDPAVREASRSYSAAARKALGLDPIPTEHASDCATHNEPAYPAGPCDCGATKPDTQA